MPSPTPRCSSYWKGSLCVTLDYNRQLYLLTYKGDQVNHCYLHKVEIENKNKILRDFEIQADQTIQDRRSDLFIVNNEKISLKMA